MDSTGMQEELVMVRSLTFFLNWQVLKVLPFWNIESYSMEYCYGGL
jgi:hypothetical protein